MINSSGIVQNNTSITKFLKELKSSKIQYKNLSKEEERDIVDEYVEVMKYEDGSDVLDMTDKLYTDWVMETNEDKKKNLYHRIKRVLVWKKSEEEFRNTLVMHNIRFVFNLSTKYCKNTRDYDNMIARGLYGLVKAANRFNPFAPVTKGDENDKKNKIVIFDENGNTIPIKFCTYAKNWIFKYIVGEFLDKTLINIDNKSVSLNSNVKINNSIDNKQTYENYIDGIIAPDYTTSKNVTETISSNTSKTFYENIEEYLRTTNDLTSLEKEIIIDTYYNGMKTKDIANKLNESTSIINTNKTKALKKLKKFVTREYKINSFDEI